MIDAGDSLVFSAPITFSCIKVSPLMCNGGIDSSLVVKGAAGQLNMLHPALLDLSAASCPGFNQCVLPWLQGSATGSFELVALRSKQVITAQVRLLNLEQAAGGLGN